MQSLNLSLGAKNNTVSSRVRSLARVPNEQGWCVIATLAGVVVAALSSPLLNSFVDRLVGG